MALCHPLPHRLQHSGPRSADRVRAEQARWVSWYRDGTDGDADDFDEDFDDGFEEGEPLWRRGKKPGVQDATDLVNYYLDHSLLPQYIPRRFTLTFFARGRFNRLFLIDFDSTDKNAEREFEGGSRMKQEPLPLPS